LDINDKKDVFFIKERISACVKCAQCMAVCSTKSVQINDFSYDDDFLDIPLEKIEYSTFLNFLKQRRSIRNFKNKEISDEILQKIIDAVEFAPYGSAHDAVHFTIVRDKTKLSKALPFMSEFYNDKIVKWLENPMMKFIIKQKKGLETYNTMKNHLYPVAKIGNYNIEYGDRITRGAPVLIIFHAEKGAEEHTKNSLIYATYAMMAAFSLGIGATFNGLVPSAINKMSELKQIFEIPENHEATISLMLGYPKYQYKRTVKRTKTNVKFI
jgi:nitroreductase